MFGFGLKDKTKKVLNNHFKREGAWTPSWLNSVVNDGKLQGYNEYDAAIWYLITDWQWMIDTWKNRGAEDKETKDRIFKEIHDEIALVDAISHLAHEDTGFQSRIADIARDAQQLQN
jgi:hypothetical protein|tara:strand:+ start:1385 stop:1735 length:351 start_codon:yes stop_codon:yes gene_type:complete